jgi:hypothetical protein
MIAMTGGRSRWLILAVLMAWVILGPIGMAFDSCAAMMTLCDGGPCGAVSAVPSSAPSFAPPIAMTTALVSPPKLFTPIPRATVEPPAKFVRLSA